MKIIIAPDSFKGSLSAAEAASCIERGIKNVIDCETVLIPMADGGEGTVEALAHTLGGKLVNVTVKGPLFDDVDAKYCIAGSTAIIEMSAASGITLVPRHRLDPLATTTYGTGQLMLDAIKKGCKKIVMGIGGSATTDGGVGMATALGVRFLDVNGDPILPCGGQLDKIHTIDISQISSELKSIDMCIACDVTNPLCGENGASMVFGPQKGATPDIARLLDSNLWQLADKIYQQLGIEVRELSGGGAAGGLGAALYAFCGAKLTRGFELISETVKLEERILGADLIITGEGRTDSQTAFGKLPCGIGNTARRLGIPCILISGAIEGNLAPLYQNGISAAFSAVTHLTTLDDAMKNAAAYLERAAGNAIRAYLMR